MWPTDKGGAMWLPLGMLPRRLVSACTGQWEAQGTAATCREVHRWHRHGGGAAHGLWSYVTQDPNLTLTTASPLTLQSVDQKPTSAASVQLVEEGKLIMGLLESHTDPTMGESWFCLCVSLITTNYLSIIYKSLFFLLFLFKVRFLYHLAGLELPM